MGSSTSKEPQTKTFIPKTPVEFSSSLLAQLDNSTESDYTRQQYAETYIQQRVKNELEKLEKLKLDQLDDELTRNLLPDENDANGSTVASINEKLNKMSEKLAELNARTGRSNPTLEIAESEIVKCLKDNKGKPLNCWDIAQDFQKAVNQL